VARVMDLPAPKFKRHNTKNSYIGNFMYMSFRTCLPTACLPVGCLPAICLSIACLHTGPVSLWLVFKLPACLPTSIYVHEFQGPPLPKLYGWGGGGRERKNVIYLLSTGGVYFVVMATLAKRKQTKASIMVFSSISKRSEHLR
jgi:hypothetical protein